MELELPPSDLMTLFLDLRFLADANEMQKPNFYSRTYSNSQGWSGWISSITRHAYGENQINNGTTEIKSICDTSNKLYNVYKNDKLYGPILIDKIKKARDGLTQIQFTYSQLGKRSEASSVETYGVLPLNMIIQDYDSNKKVIVKTNSTYKYLPSMQNEHYHSPEVEDIDRE